MKLLLIRHADAEDTSPTGDAGRRLSRRGREQARSVGLALRRMGVIPALILASPRVRARETAEGIAEAFKSQPPPSVARALDCGARWADLVQELAERDLRPAEDDPRWVLAVGHQPDLGEMVSEALGGPTRPLPFKKAGCVGLAWKHSRPLGLPDICLALDPDLAAVLAEQTP